MRKTLLEKYLYLLTEDPEMDAFDQEYKGARLRLLKLGAGPEGSDALSSKYKDVPFNKIPPEHQQKLNDFRKAKDEFEEISKKRSQYSQWVRNGRTGPKPWEYEERLKNFRNGFYQSNERMRKASEELRRAQERYNKSMQKAYKFNRRLSTTIYVLYALIIASQIYRYFITADHVCNLLVGKKKEICKIKYRIKALTKQQENLKNSLINTNKTSNPKESKMKIQKKINEISKTIKILKIKLKELNEQ